MRDLPERVARLESRLREVGEAPRALRIHFRPAPPGCDFAPRPHAAGRESETQLVVQVIGGTFAPYTEVHEIDGTTTRTR